MVPHSSYSKINERMLLRATTLTFFFVIITLGLGDGAYALSIRGKQIAIQQKPILIDRPIELPKCKLGYQALGDLLCVKHYDRKETWSGARDFCRKQKSDLLVLRNKEINKKFKEMSISTEGWIGLNKLYSGSNYVWLDEPIFTTNTKTKITTPYKKRVHIHAGSEVVIQGKAHHDAKWFDVALLQDRSKNSDICLAISIVYDSSPNVLVLNSKVNDKWGKEKSQDLTLNKGEPFELRIKAEQDKYKLFVNNKFVTDYKNHKPKEELNLKGIQLSGKMNISSLTCHHKTAYYNNVDQSVSSYRDTDSGKCVMYHSFNNRPVSKNWINEKCAARRPFFCAYHKFKSNPIEHLLCPDSRWTLFNRMCFMKSTFDFPYTTAKYYCSAIGATLAKITAKDEIDSTRLKAKDLGQPVYWVANPSSPFNPRARSGHLFVDGSVATSTNWRINGTFVCQTNASQGKPKLIYVN